MSTQLFDRVAVVTVLETYDNVSTSSDGSVSFGRAIPSTSGTEFSSVQSDGSPGYRIKFHVDKMTEGNSATTSIFIYNLGRDSRALFERQNNIVTLKVGYGDSLEQIFKGDIQRTRTRREGPDYVTQIELSDGFFANTWAKTDVSFKTGVTKSALAEQLIQDAEKSGVTRGYIKGIPTDGYNHPVVLSGKSIDKLRDLCESNNLQMSIQDGEIVIVPFGESNADTAVVLSKDTGMVGSPEMGEGTRVSVKSLLNPKIKPFTKISIISKFLFNFETNKSLSGVEGDNGATLPGGAVYTAVKVIHSGDTFGTEWYTHAECV